MAYQADVLRDTLILAFAHPRIVGVQQWGVWENSMWLKNAALWRNDWSIKPIGQAYVDLVTKTWTTDERRKVGTDGRLAVRAFYGDYRITVEKDGKVKTVEVSFRAGDDELKTIQF